jgi:hypothetical protein
VRWLVRLFVSLMFRSTAANTTPAGSTASAGNAHHLRGHQAPTTGSRRLRPLGIIALCLGDRIGIVLVVLTRQRLAGPVTSTNEPNGPSHHPTPCSLAIRTTRNGGVLP